MKFLLVLLAALAVGATPIADPGAEPEAHPEAYPEAFPEADPEIGEAEKRGLEKRGLEKRTITVRTKTTLKCRAGATTNSAAHRQFAPGTNLRAACGVNGQSVNGQTWWLKIDPGPRLPWCYVLAYYTNYYDPSVPFSGIC